MYTTTSLARSRQGNRRKPYPVPWVLILVLLSQSKGMHTQSWAMCHDGIPYSVGPGARPAGRCYVTNVSTLAGCFVGVVGGGASPACDGCGAGGRDGLGTATQHIIAELVVLGAARVVAQDVDHVRILGVRAVGI